MASATADMDISWQQILHEPFVCLILGSRGSGKTALAHALLEEYRTDDRDAYILNFPDEKRHLLPDWIEILPATVTRETWPEESVVLVHEAHHLLHARRSLDAENLELDKLVSVSRHKDSNIIYETQMSQRLDKNAVAAVDGICVRWPALMQEQFERRAVRPVIKDAREVLEKYVDVHDGEDFTYVERVEDDDGVDKLKKHVYVHADQFRGEYPQEVGLADHWSESISKAYGDAEEAVTEDAEDEPDEDDDAEDPLEAFVADETTRGILSRVVQWERTHKNGWSASDIGAGGGHISAMLSAGLIRNSYSSNSQTRYELADHDRVADALDEHNE